MRRGVIAGYLKKAVHAVSFSASDPRSDQEKKGPIETAILIDTSGSMSCTDYAPSRLGAAQAAAMELVVKRQSSEFPGRITVAGFSDQGVSCCPLLSAGDPRIKTAIYSTCAKGSTNYGAGFKITERIFVQARIPAPNCEIVMVSDGLNREGEDPVALAEYLKSFGCIIRTFGIGSKEKGIDEELLRAIASRDSLGAPLYRFIPDREGLIRCYGEIGGLTR